MMDSTDQLLQQILTVATRVEARQIHTEAAVARIEAKQDVLVGALAEDDEPLSQATLEGADAGRDRDQSQSLDNTSK